MVNRDLRPEKLQDLAGNSVIKKTFVTFFKNPEKMPRVFLFTGETGTGKTTLARIIANELRINKRDVKELDSAHFRGIDTAREFNKQVRYEPQGSPYALHIIDEVHKWTKDAQNAVLKTLEEPPARSIIVLCTTNPEKLIKTIKGRCYQFQLKSLSENEMKRFLVKIAKKIGYSLDKQTFEKIYKTSEGRPREALSYLELAASGSTQFVELEKDSAVAIDIARELMNYKSNWRSIKTLLKSIKDKESDVETIRRVVMGYCTSVLLNSDNYLAGLIMENFVTPFYNTPFPELVFACYNIYKVRNQ